MLARANPQLTPEVANGIAGSNPPTNIKDERKLEYSKPGNLSPDAALSANHARRRRNEGNSESIVVDGRMDALGESKSSKQARRSRQNT
ncbi:MAG TPA: hypothetical protein DEH78_09215 [Solibacterales bacterium]|nr:hypothetical protein [Bryobacterales bacterium]